jgi:adenylate cyclase
MAEGKVKRKLSAILSADVKGYSRLMGEDEVRTIRTLKEYRKVVGDLIQGHGGRVVDAPGDNVLAEFASVVNAVASAVEIQNALALKNVDLPENRRMKFRIGINLGDVIEEEERIYGEGVNIAARIEALAEPGGICISGTAYDQIENKLPFCFDYLGRKSVKNIKTPIRVYRLLLESSSAMSGRVVELPENPSIAVLPFINMSGDPEQEYFSDGITEDLITDLSKIAGLFVIARNSVFTYKNRPVTAQQVSQELGVRYLLEGSIRKAGERVRITAQFIDGSTGRHLWADRFDRRLGDIFALQDELTQRIIAVLSIKMGEEEHKRLAAKGTRNLAAYDLFLHGLEYINQYTREANEHARITFKKALVLDPGYAIAHEKMGWTYFIEWVMGWSDDPESLNQAFKLGQKAAAFDALFEGSHCLLGNIYLWRKEHDKAVEFYEKALTLNPNYANGLADLGGVLAFAGRPKEAIELIERALRLDPFFPYHLFNLGHAYFLCGDYEEALGALGKAISGNPDFPPARAFRAAIFAEMGRDDEARAEVAVILKKSPGTTTALWRERLPYKNSEDLERVLVGLRNAGMP